MCKKDTKTVSVNLPTLKQHGIDDNGYPVYQKLIGSFDICNNCLQEISKSFYEKLKW